MERSERVHIRVSERTKKQLELAADIKDQTLSEFVRDTALIEACMIILEELHTPAEEVTDGGEDR